MRTAPLMNKASNFQLSLSNITLVSENSPILNGINFSIKNGEHWVLLGPNGSGKSSLISIVTRYRWPTTGTVQLFINGKSPFNTVEWRSTMGLFFPASQDGLQNLHPGITALDVVISGIDGALAIYHDYPEEEIQNARHLMDLFFDRAELFYDRPYRNLSSGERRKILFLRTLMTQPEFLIFDEPFEFLDIKARVELARMIRSTLQERQIPSSLTVLHRIEEIPDFITHGALMASGKIQFAGEIDQIIRSDRLSEIYETPLNAGKTGNHFFCFPEEA